MSRAPAERVERLRLKLIAEVVASKEPDGPVIIEALAGVVAAYVGGASNPARWSRAFEAMLQEKLAEVLK